MTQPQIIQAEKPQRDALIIYAFLGRLGKKCTKNEVLEAVSSSARDNTLDWAQDAVSGFGFLCNGGYTKVSNITPAITPALAVGKNGQLAIVEKVRKDFDDRHINHHIFEVWASGQGCENAIESVCLYPPAEPLED